MGRPGSGIRKRRWPVMESNEESLPRHLDLFSGIGGFAIASKRAGFQTIGFSEIDEWCATVLKRDWPGIPNYGDIRGIPTIRCELITGGFPCQPFSCAGKRAGSADDRYLWPAMLDVIGRCQPDYVLGENVAGIEGLELHRVLDGLESVGYWTWPIAIPACAANRPIVRKRIYILAMSKCQRRERRRQRDNGASMVEWREAEIWKSDSRPCGRCASFVRAQEAIAVMGMADGLPTNARGIKALGNAVVPQIIEAILRAIP